MNKDKISKITNEDIDTLNSSCVDDIIVLQADISLKVVSINEVYGCGWVCKKCFFKSDNICRMINCREKFFKEI